MAAAAVVVEEKVYPAALLSHEDVVRNPAAFMETLRRFHSTLGTKFMIPVIGGKDLDLHMLYVQVTQRGGLDKVVREKRWREVIAVFNFPPTTTSASFVLRKYYISLLHHYEKVYFFRLQGPLVPPEAALHAKSPPCKATKPGLPETRQLQLQQLQFHHPPKKRKATIASLQNGGSQNFTVIGMIDGKFEHGYLVTVKMGMETLHGVLYHALPLGVAGAAPSPSPLMNGIVSFPSSNAEAPTSSRVHRRRRRGWRRFRDPTHPKPNRSAYNFFFAEKHSKLKVLYPNREREFSKMIGDSWNKLTQEERMVYQDWGMKDKERYKREMQEYKERLKLIQPPLLLEAPPMKENQELK
ncbi:High mobility group B protein 9 [Acorus gramineus]|uniref:High mobility group B protein 9 n=1 Tax=Acorus gramineus TaxID=55184 RepID=A0AAV9ACU2_ACOGR|nr:High mobility group B protein 9 [Acorus gramineus]